MVAIPADWTDLLTRALYAHFVTLGVDGDPDVVTVWTDYDGEHVLVNADRADVHATNAESDPRVALSVLDPGDPERHLAIRGRVVGFREAGAVAHVKCLAERYLGDGSTAWQYDAPTADRVVLEIRPDVVTTTGYHNERLPNEE